jgi:hypothetical protein
MNMLRTVVTKFNISALGLAQRRNRAHFAAFVALFGFFVGFPDSGTQVPRRCVLPS